MSPPRPGSARPAEARPPRGTGSAASAADRSDFLYHQSRLFRAAFLFSGSRCLPSFFPGRISLILHLQPVCPAAELGGVIGPGAKEHPGSPHNTGPIMQAAATVRQRARSGRTVPITAIAQGFVTAKTAISAEAATASTSRGLLQTGTVKRLRRSDLHSKQWISWVDQGEQCRCTAGFQAAAPGCHCGVCSQGTEADEQPPEQNGTQQAAGEDGILPAPGDAAA